MKRFSNINDDNEYFSKKGKFNKSLSKYNLKDSIYPEIAYDLGTKIGLIKAASNLKHIKTNGIIYLENFINNIKENIFDYLQEYNINDKYSLSNDLKNNQNLFFKHYHNFCKGFYYTFFKYINLNLKQYPNIQNYIQLEYSKLF